MAGRPTDYSTELAVQICTLISEGMSLKAVCAEKDIPDKATIFRWLAKNEPFRDLYARAKEDAMNAMAEEIVEIADDTAKDTHTTTYENGREVVSPNTEWISRSRLRVDTRKWLMSKLAPKKYGDKLTAEVGGVGGGPLMVGWLKPE